MVSLLYKTFTINRRHYKYLSSFWLFGQLAASKHKSTCRSWLTIEKYCYWKCWFVVYFDDVFCKSVLCVFVLETRYRYSWTWNWALVSWGVHVKCLQQCHLHSFPFPLTNVTCNRNLVLLIKFIKIRLVSPSNVTLKAASLELKWWTQMDNFVVSARNIYFW